MISEIDINISQKCILDILKQHTVSLRVLSIYTHTHAHMYTHTLTHAHTDRYELICTYIDFRDEKRPPCFQITL